MQMRAGRATGHAHKPDRLRALDFVTGFHHLLALMQIAGRHAVAVIENGEAAFEIEVRFGERDER